MSYLKMIPLFSKDATPTTKEKSHFSSTMLVLHDSTFPHHKDFLRSRAVLPEEGDESFIIDQTRTRSFKGSVKGIVSICHTAGVVRDYQYLYAKELKDIGFKRPNMLSKINLLERILRGLGLICIVCHESDMAIEALYALPDNVPILVEMH